MQLVRWGAASILLFATALSQNPVLLPSLPELAVGEYEGSLCPVSGSAESALDKRIPGHGLPVIIENPKNQTLLSGEAGICVGYRGHHARPVEGAKAENGFRFDDAPE